MTEAKLKLSMQEILPMPVDMPAEACSGCLNRLERELTQQKGINRVHLDANQSPAALCCHYNADLVQQGEVRRLARRAGLYISQHIRHDTLMIEGMDCSDCSNVIEHSLRRVDGVLDVKVNYSTQSMRVEFDAQKTGRRAIEARLHHLGYGVPLGGVQGWLAGNRELVASLLSGLFLLIAWTSTLTALLPMPVILAGYAAAYAAGLWYVGRHAWRALRQRHFDTDLLMVVAAFGAAAVGSYAEGGLLLFLFSLGHALEEYALGRARSAIKSLADLAPKTALIAGPDGQTSEVRVEDVPLGARVFVRPGVRIPVDGLITAGQSGVNQSPVTGESMPVDKIIGDRVFAGSVNGQGTLEVVVDRLAKDSTLSRVIHMVEEAQAQKSPTQQTLERFERVFVPIVLSSVALLIIVPPLFGVPFQISFLRAMALLIAASPCALALGTPAAILSGIAQGARRGVLIKGGVHLENLARLKVVAFDKTGTITHGRPEVTDLIAFDPQVSKDQLLTLAASVESRSAHPLAGAVVRAAELAGLALTPVEDVESITGSGIRARLDGRTVDVGSSQWFEINGVQLSEDQAALVEALQSTGKTVMLVASADRLIGALALADTVRAQARGLVQALHAAGVTHTVMLTGDNPRSAAAIAAQAGIEHVQAGLLPADKLAAVSALEQEFGPVAMVGDGVNDAPALANATVGIAMGGASTDVALETADVALMGNDLMRLPFAISLGRASQSIIRQNLVIALGVIALLAVATLTGLIGIGAAVFFHEGSTLVVVLNALRLLTYNGSA